MKELRRSQKERFMHGDNLRDYEQMHKARHNEIETFQKKAHEFMKRKPYGIKKEIPSEH